MKNLRYYSIGFFLLLFSACIPIDDRLEPIISPNTLKSFYYWQDTLNVSVVVTDNDKLESIVLELKPVEITSPWKINETIAISGGRKYDLNYKKIVPLNATPGFYIMTVTCYDKSRNRSIYSYKFEVLGDIRAPYLGIKPTNLTQMPDKTYLGCRSQAVLFEGYIKDNIGIGSLTVEFDNYPKIVYNLNGVDSVDINKLLRNDVRIPQNLADGKTLALKFYCVDTDGNLTTKTIMIYVDCDDQPPVLTVEESYPQFQDGRVTVIQGTKFTIEKASASDNRFLQDLIVIFNKRGAAKDTIYDTPIESEDEVDLIEMFGDISVEMPSSANPGDRYDFYMLVTDSAKLTSEIFYLEMITGRDEPPLILLTNTQKNDLEQTWSTSTNNIVAPGDNLRIDGKILEDVAFEYLKISWGLVSDMKVIVDLDASDLLGRLPFNLADPISKNVFEVADKIPTSSNNLYRLEIEVKDKKNSPVKKIYTFKVQ